MIKHLVSFAAVLLFLISAVQAEPTVSFSPAKSKVTAGDTFSVSIVMADFPTTEGGGVTLRFKPSVVQVTGVIINTGTWSFASQAGDIDNGKGKVRDIVFSAFPGTAGDAVIATVGFRAIKRGRTRLRLQESGLNPFASGGQPVAVVFDKGRLVVKGNKAGRRNTNKGLSSKKSRR